MSVNSRPVEPRGSFVSGCQHGPLGPACRRINRLLLRMLRPGMFRRVEIGIWSSPDGRYDAWRLRDWSRTMPIYCSDNVVLATLAEQFAIDRALRLTIRWSNKVDICRGHLPRITWAPAQYVYLHLARQRHLPLTHRRTGSYA